MGCVHDHVDLGQAAEGAHVADVDDGTGRGGQVGPGAPGTASRRDGGHHTGHGGADEPGRAEHQDVDHAEDTTAETTRRRPGLNRHRGAPSRRSTATPTSGATSAYLAKVALDRSGCSVTGLQVVGLHGRLDEEHPGRWSAGWSKCHGWSVSTARRWPAPETSTRARHPRPTCPPRPQPRAAPVVRWCTGAPCPATAGRSPRAARSAIPCRARTVSVVEEIEADLHAP